MHRYRRMYRLHEDIGIGADTGACTGYTRVLEYVQIQATQGFGYMRDTGTCTGYMGYANMRRYRHIYRLHGGMRILAATGSCTGYMGYRNMCRHRRMYRLDEGIGI